MNSEILNIVKVDFLAFARKALRELDGTRISEDRYLELLSSHLMDFADGKTKRLLINLHQDISKRSYALFASLPGFWPTNRRRRSWSSRTAKISRRTLPDLFATFCGPTGSKADLGAPLPEDLERYEISSPLRAAAFTPLLLTAASPGSVPT